MSKKCKYITIFGKVTEQWYDWITFSEKISVELNFPINYCARAIAGANPRDSLKAYTPKRAAAIKSENLEWLELISSSVTMGDIYSDWNMHIFRDTGHYKPGRLFAGFESDCMSWPEMAELARKVMKFIAPVYGFGEEEEKSRIPMLSSAGTSTGDHSWREGIEIARWGRDLMKERRFAMGIFRAAFRFNLLTAPHLAQMIGSSTVQSAIETGLLPGVLSPLTDTAWLWELKVDEVARADELLAENGLTDYGNP